MKNRLFNLFAAVFLLTALLLPQTAVAAGSSFEGDDELRAGDRVTVTYYVNGDSLYAVTASMDYDSSQLEWLSISSEMGGAWKLEENGSSHILLYDTGVSSPIDGWEAAFSVTFRVRSGVSVGDTVSASISATASDGVNDISLNTAYWEAEILPALSDDAELDDLWCDETDIGFTGGSEYSITVPYSVSSLSLDWDRSHSGASVSVSGNSLSVGENTVTVSVTAEDGTTRRYYIYVTREQDPNYKASQDAALRSLTVSAGQLSPKFDPNITDYVVYLPYEATEIYATGTARDSKAAGVQQSDKRIPVLGSNILRVVCTAEDGVTTKEYRIEAIRMPQYSTQPAKPDADKPTEPAQDNSFLLLELPATLTLPFIGEVELLWVAIAAGILLVLLLILLLLLVWFAGKKKGRRVAEKTAAALPAEPAPPAEAALGVTAAADDAEEMPVEAEEAPSSEENPAEAAETAEEQPEESAEDADSSAPSGEDTAEPAPSAEETPADDAPAEEPPAEAAPADEEKAIGRMSLSELLDEIRGM